MTHLDELTSRVPGASLHDGFPPDTVDVPASAWLAAVTAAKEQGFSFLDFLSAVDEEDGVRVVCHLVRPSPFAHVVLRALLEEPPEVTSVASVFEGASWHERESAEMFGIRFLAPTGERLELAPLLLPPGFGDHPLRKRYPLQARVETPWPGEKEPS